MTLEEIQKAYDEASQGHFPPNMALTGEGLYYLDKNDNVQFIPMEELKKNGFRGL